MVACILKMTVLWQQQQRPKFHMQEVFLKNIVVGILKSVDIFDKKGKQKRKKFFFY